MTTQRFGSIAAIVAAILIVFLIVGPPPQGGQSQAVFEHDETYKAWKRLTATPEGREAWRQFSNTLTVYEYTYHRKLEGKELFERFVKSMTDLDPHSSYLTKEAFQQMQRQMRGAFGGIGVEITRTADSEPVKGIKIVSPIDDTPGARAGLKAGDIIVEIKDEHGVYQPTAPMTVDQAVSRLTGPVDTPVEFAVHRASENRRIEFRIVRATVRLQFVKRELRQDIGYIKILSFGEPTTDQFRAAVQWLEAESMNRNGKPIMSYVIDLRNNPGGLLDQADGVLDATLRREQYPNVDASVTISTESRGRRSPDYNASRADDATGGKPILVLVNGGSASASEIVAGVLQIHGRAIIAGPVKRTFGKGTVQTIVPTPDGAAVRLTTSQYLIGSRGCERPIQGKGVVPDIELEAPEGFNLTVPHEEELPGSIGTSGVSDTECRYRYTVSDEHKSAVPRMLEVMNLKRATAAQ